VIAIQQLLSNKSMSTQAIAKQAEKDSVDVPADS
jgi:hypothetical protein